MGSAPAASEVVRVGIVPLGSLETIEARGTAVGFVDKREMEILGVELVLVVTEPLTETEEETVPDVDGADVGPECEELALVEVEA